MKPFDAGWFKAAALGACMLFTLSACEHVSRINTEPEGARVFINGVPIGTTPTIYKSRSGLPETLYVKIEKKGYKTLDNITIDKHYRADVSLALLLLGIVPYFFSARLEDQYIWPLIPEGEETGADNSGAGERKDSGLAKTESTGPEPEPLSLRAPAARAGPEG